MGQQATLRGVLAGMQRVDREIDFYQRIPAAIDVEGVTIPLGSCFRAFSTALLELSHGRKPEHVVFEKAPNLPDVADHAYFSAPTFTKPSYPDGFTGTGICDACRRQSWTYKPAMRRKVLDG